MEIHIKTIPHNRQRYETVGDYYFDKKGVLQIRISDMNCQIYEQMVALHELSEVMMVLHKGIKMSDIDKFDKAFEAKRKEGNTDEPGDDPKAPYRNEHLIATAIEKTICGFLNISWKHYDDTVNSL